MWTVLLIACAFVVGLIFLFRSDFGKDVQTKTDQQLYQRYNAYMQLSKKALDHDLNKWVEANQEATRTSDELERRGYDLSKLFSEEADAKCEGRSMDFSRARRGKTVPN